MIALVGVIVTAYLLGSLSSAILFCRLRGLPDPRGQGSKNPGATNVLRYAGRLDAAFVLLGDVSKGLLAVLIARWFHMPEAALGWVALAAFLGHLYPVFFQFKGGKGVATALGGLLGLCWPLALSVLLVWLVVAALSRYSSLAAVFAAIATPFLSWWWGVPYILPIILMSIFLLVRHQKNIQQLWLGEESKIGR